ncbi:MAG: hypothetical protein QOH21_365 [Acidobacteriota bacterium]|jgi:SAM-dependent methyltransferase|nr:hypothetical protein [Acidobacteriota bacterium]
MLRKSRLLRLALRWTTQFVDPFRAARAFRGVRWYLQDYRAYRRMPGAERIRLLDTYPSFGERGATHDFDAHYFYANPWVARRVVAARPARHVDVASQTVLATMLSATLPVTYIDYRALRVSIPGMTSLAGDLTRLPLRDRSVPSLSCIHVAEHVGLGRYGDPIDPAGTKRAAAELARVLAPGGRLYFALPVGQPRVEFNAHRVHAAAQIVDYFSGLRLEEYSGIGDDGRYYEHVPLDRFVHDRYACGLFVFTRP